MTDRPTTDLSKLTDEQLVAHLDSLNREDEEDRARLNDPGALARAARWYAQQGVAIFPLRVGGKIPLLGKAHQDPVEQRECRRGCGKDGHGLYDATTDPARVTAWWQQTPQANIGIRTGLGFDVVDIDGPAGVREWADMVRHARCDKRPDGITPACCDAPGQHCPGDGVTEAAMLGTVYGVVRTGGDNGGLHYYIAPTGQANGAKMLGGHVDYRGDGGYVVAPPSRVRARYVWTEQLDVAALRQDVA